MYHGTFLLHSLADNATPCLHLVLAQCVVNFVVVWCVLVVFSALMALYRSGFLVFVSALVSWLIISELIKID